MTGDIESLLHIVKTSLGELPPAWEAAIHIATCSFQTLTLD